MALGADGVQIGSGFAATKESSAHDNFKQLIIKAQEGSTELLMKKLTPVRLLKNKFYEQVKTAEMGGASQEQLQNLLGKGRAKKGMFEGDLLDGELEIGQVAALITQIISADDLVKKIWNEFLQEANKLKTISDSN